MSDKSNNLTANSFMIRTWTSGLDNENRIKIIELFDVVESDRDLKTEKLQAAEEENSTVYQSYEKLDRKLQALEEENKILREAVEKYRKELRLCYSEDHKDFYPKEIDIELDKALEKVRGGE